MNINVNAQLASGDTVGKTVEEIATEVMAIFGGDAANDTCVVAMQTQPGGIGPGAPQPPPELPSPTPTT